MHTIGGTKCNCEFVPSYTSVYACKGVKTLNPADTKKQSNCIGCFSLYRCPWTSEPTEGQGTLDGVLTSLVVPVASNKVQGYLITPYGLRVCSKRPLIVQWKLDLADTSLAENLSLKDTPQKIWATIFDF